MTIVVGSQIWVENPELVWIDGEVINIKGEDAEIQISNGNKVQSCFIFFYDWKSCYYLNLNLLVLFICL